MILHQSGVKTHIGDCCLIDDQAISLDGAADGIVKQVFKIEVFKETKGYSLTFQVCHLINILLITQMKW